MRKRRVLLLTVGGLVLLCVALVPVVLNALIVRRLDLNLARTRITEVLQSQTGLSLTVQGVKYRFLRGIVFHGVRVQAQGAPHGSFLLQAESMMLQLSLWQALRGELPFNRLVVTEGRLNPYVLSGPEWNRVLESFASHQEAVRKRKTQPGQVTALDFSEIDIAGQDLRLVVPEYVITGGRRRIVDRIRIDFMIRPGRRTWNISMLTGRSEGAAHLEARGRWQGESSRRLNFRFDRVPLPLLYRLSARLPVWPAELRIPLERMHMAEGFLNGRGSLDLVGAGLGINFEGEYEKVHVSLGRADGFYAAVENASGKFRYNTAYFDFVAGPVHAEFDLEQPDLKIRLRFRNIKTKQKEEHFAEATITSQPTLAESKAGSLRMRLPGGPLAGELAFNLYYDQARGWLQPKLNVALKDIRVSLQSPLFRMVGPKGKDYHPELRVTSASIKQAPKERLKITAHGDLDGAPFKIEADSESYFEITPHPEEPSLAVFQDLKGTVVVEGLPYRLFLVPALRVHTQLIDSGSRPDADKAEEHGLLRKYQFIDEIYRRGLLDFTKLDLRISLRKMKDAGRVWPQDIELLVYKKDSYIWLQMPEARGPSSRMSGELTTVFQRPMPYHKATAVLEVSQNHLSFPELLHNDSIPTDIIASFDSDGQGWLPYDIIDRTYSRMKLQVKGANLAFLAPAVILKHKIGLGPKDFQAKSFSLERRTDSNHFLYSGILFESDRLLLRGYGDYVTQQGGQFTFQYELRPPLGAKAEPVTDSLELTVTAQEKWVPKSPI